MKDYFVYVKVKDLDAFDKASSIAFQAGKHTCGCGFASALNAQFYIWGKFSDYVRVHAALKSNGFEILRNFTKENDDECYR